MAASHLCGTSHLLLQSSNHPALPIVGSYRCCKYWACMCLQPAHMVWRLLTNGGNKQQRCKGLRVSSGVGLEHVVCMHVHSLRDMLYRRRMERQLAQARGLAPGPERPPDEDVRLQTLPRPLCPCCSPRAFSLAAVHPSMMLQGKWQLRPPSFACMHVIFACLRELRCLPLTDCLACKVWCWVLVAWLTSHCGVHAERPEPATRGGQQAGRVRAAQPARRRRRRRRQHAPARGEQRPGDQPQRGHARGRPAGALCTRAPALPACRNLACPAAWVGGATAAYACINRQILH